LHTQDSNLSPLIITKYSQPFELILFHIIKAIIKYHKDSNYPQLLNNYLNFSGLTGSSQTIDISGIPDTNNAVV